MHNLLQKPALTDILCITCIRIVHCSKVTKCVWCPYSTNAFTWTLHDCEYTLPKLQCNKCGIYLERQTPSLVNKEPHFQARKWSWKESKLGRGSQWGSKSRTVLLSASSNLLDSTGQDIS